MPLVANKVAEAEIRRWLVEQGYGARAAKFDEVELVAIERPGWVQVFRFRLTARTPEGEKRALFGVARDDGRQGGEFRVSTSEKERDGWLDEWSHGLIRAGSRSFSRWAVALLVAIFALVGLALLAP